MFATATLMTHEIKIITEGGSDTTCQQSFLSLLGEVTLKTAQRCGMEGAGRHSTLAVTGAFRLAQQNLQKHSLKAVEGEPFHE